MKVAKWKFKALIGFFFFGILLFILLFSVGGGDIGGGGDEDLQGQNLPEKVLAWQKKVKIECDKNDISGEVNTILAIIAVESGGDAEKTPDIMQSSESQGGQMGTIKDPNKSIEVGVAYYASNYKLGKGAVKDRMNAVQAYNYGGGYMGFAKEKYSFDDAMAFSKKQAGGQKVGYPNPVAIELGYNWRYAYGNMFYVALVKKYLQSGGASGTGKYIIPVKNPNVSSGFVDRINPITHVEEHHKGLDFAQPMDDSILAADDGVVIFAGMGANGNGFAGYGNVVLLEHKKNKEWTLYAHQNAVKVFAGQTVKKGATIGLVGSTGQSTGPHLHFEIRKEKMGGQVDPAPILGVIGK